MTKTLFVAFSHALTEGQISDAKKSLGVDKIITLAEVAPELQKSFSQVDPRASQEDVSKLAKDVFAEALKVGADYIYVAGEPTLMMYISLLPSAYSGFDIGAFAASRGIKLAPHKKDFSMSVVQSTTERKSSESVQPDGTVLKTAVFQHVQWRVVFE